MLHMAGCLVRCCSGTHAFKACSCMIGRRKVGWGQASATSKLSSLYLVKAAFTTYSAVTARQEKS